MAETNAERNDSFLKMADEINQSVPANRLAAYKNAHNPQGNPRYWAIVDFNQPSTEKRFYLFDTKSETVTQYYVAHGHGNGDAIRAENRLYAKVFSNEKESNCSSLGIYSCSSPIDSPHHGNALQIKGLEATNSKAEARSIILHRAEYVSDAYKNQHGYMGCSKGCFAVENSVIDTLVAELKNGSYIIAWKS